MVEGLMAGDFTVTIFVVTIFTTDPAPTTRFASIPLS
jgi:hypothetical protein